MLKVSTKLKNLIVGPTSAALKAYAHFTKPNHRFTKCTMQSRARKINLGLIYKDERLILKNFIKTLYQEIADTNQQKKFKFEGNAALNLDIPVQ